MCGGSSSSSSDAILNQEKSQQAALSKGGKAIENAFSGFGSSFFQQAQKDYEASQLPQLGKQYRTAGKNLNYKYSGQGLANSSAATEARNALQEAKQSGIQTVESNANTAVQNLQDRIAAQKSALYNQLSVSQNPTQIANAALTSASTLSAPSTLAPLGQMFSDFSNMYLAKATSDAATSTTTWPTLLALNNQSQTGYLGSTS